MTDQSIQEKLHLLQLRQEREEMEEMFARWFYVVGLSACVADDPDVRADVLAETGVEGEIVRDYILGSTRWLTSDESGLVVGVEPDMVWPLEEAPDSVPDSATLPRVEALWARELRKIRQRVEHQVQRLEVLAEEVPEPKRDSRFAERARKLAETLGAFAGSAKGIADLIRSVLQNY